MNMTVNSSSWYESGMIFRDEESLCAMRETFNMWFERYGCMLTEAMVVEYSKRDKSDK